MVELSSLTLCTRVSSLLQMLLYYFTLYIIFRVILPKHSQSLYEELSFWISPVGQLHLDQISFGPFPLTKNPL